MFYKLIGHAIKYKFRMNYLKKKNLKKGRIIIYKGESLKLLDHDITCDSTFIESDTKYKSSDMIDKDIEVFIRQRWKVEIQPETPFDKPFTTHRYIESYLCKYSEIVDDVEIDDPMWKNNKIDSNELGDDFNGII